MKTLVVLSALASIVIAAPAQQEDFDKTQTIQNSWLDHNNREKKSPLDTTSQTSIAGLNDFNSESELPNARSFALKKPLIVKNKHGYRLYRDSEEEKALTDSQQTCGRQIRVKVCDEDAKVTDTMRSLAQENIRSSEDDIKFNIKMAKEAVENLQTELKKMDRNGDSNLKSEILDPEELHDEIEVARQDLGHIQNDFGNLETMNLHATATRDSDAVHDVHLTVAKTEGERMAQWKQAIENIHKNVEIAKNIEDSFKSAQDLSLSEFSLPKNEQQLEENSDLQLAVGENMQMRLMEDDHHDIGKKPTTCILTNFTLTDFKKENTTDSDMKPSASSINEFQIDPLMNDKLERKVTFINEKTETRDSDVNKNSFETDQMKQSENSDMNRVMVKLAEQETSSKSDKEISLKSSENILDSIVQPPMIINTDVFSVNQKNTEEKGADNPTDFLTFFKTSEHENPIHENSIQIQPKLNEELFTEISKTESNENLKERESSKDFVTFRINEQMNARSGVNIKEKLEKSDLPLDTEQTENFMTFKSSEPLKTNQHNIDKGNLNRPFQVKTLEERNSMENFNNLNDNTNIQPPRFVDDKKNLDKMSSMKVAEHLVQGFHGFDHSNHMNLNEHRHLHTEMDSMKNFGMSDHSQFHSGDFHHDLMSHGNMADLNTVMQPNFHTGMRDAMGDSENAFRWQPNHEIPRTAYNTGVLNSPGAVGVFPNANTGSCGIPLLLSCSPSVVSGSMAKAHSTGSGTYPSPAYRSEDDFSFHNKRDIKKTKGNLNTHVQPPMTLKQNSKTMFEINK